MNLAIGLLNGAVGLFMAWVLYTGGYGLTEAPLAWTVAATNFALFVALALFRKIA